MVLSKRERNIVIATVATLAAVGLYYFIIDPQIKTMEDLKTSINNTQNELDKDNQIIRRSKQLKAKWAEMQNAGLGRDGSQAATNLFNNANGWARQSGLAEAGLREDRTEKMKDFFQVGIRVSGSGGMSQISQFLFSVLSSKNPVKVTDMQIASRKDGIDDLTLQLGLATIFLAPEPDPNAPKPAAPSAPKEPAP